MGKAIVFNGNVQIVEANRRTAPVVNAERLSGQVRLKRNKLLENSDWTQLADCPLSEEKKEEYKVYRQALRDITSQEGFPFSVQFPSLIMGV